MARPFAKQARSLVQASLVDGRISTDRVKKVLDAVSKTKIAHKAGIIKEYYRQIELWQQRHQVTVTSATELSEATKTALMTSVTSQYPEISEFAWQHDQNLIGGITVQVGDNWHDLSIRGGLTTIREHIRK